MAKGIQRLDVRRRARRSPPRSKLPIHAGQLLHQASGPRRSKSSPSSAVLYTRASSRKDEDKLSNSIKRQLEAAAAAAQRLGTGFPIQKISEVPSGRLPPSKRPRLVEFLEGTSGARKICVESARVSPQAAPCTPTSRRHADKILSRK